MTDGEQWTISAILTVPLATGMAYLAFRHPKRFRDSAPWGGLVIFAVIAAIGIWNSATRTALANVRSLIPANHLATAEALIASLQADPVTYAVLAGLFLFGALLMVIGPPAGQDK